MHFFTKRLFSTPSLVHQWERIALRTSQVDPFCSSPAWQLAFHDSEGSNGYLLVEGQEDSMVAFALKHIAGGNLPVGIYLAPLESAWCFGCPILGPNGVHLLAQALDFAQTLLKQPVNALVSGIRPEGRLAKALTKQFDNGKYRILQHNTGCQACASLRGGLDGFLSRRSGNFRCKLKKSMKVAADTGIYFERVAPQTPELARQVYDRILLIEQQSWKGLGHCGMNEPGAREFYACLTMRLAALKRVRVIFAKHENKDIGFIFGGMAGRIYRGQQFSYVDTWRKYSIGNLLQREKLQWLCEDGAVRYDMGPIDNEAMRYKHLWTEQKHLHETWAVCR